LLARSLPVAGNIREESACLDGAKQFERDGTWLEET